MPLNKSAFLRYRIIDACLTNRLRRYPTMEQILEKIGEQVGEISTSMFNKDIQAMKEIYSAPIRYNRQHRGYEYSDENFSIRDFPLTAEEVEALDLSTSLLGLLRGTSIFQQYENAINKVIEGYRVSKLLGNGQYDVIQAEEPVVKSESHWLEPLLKSIIEKKLLSISYQPFHRPGSEHRFSPYLLKEYRNRWYLIGHSANKDRVLVLALDRIQDVKPTRGAFVTDPGFSPQDFFRYSIGITQLHGLEPEEVELSFTPAQAQYIISQPLHHSQELISEDETEYRVRLKLYLTPELRMTILSFGTGVKVIRPYHFRNEMVKLIGEMKALYDKDAQP